MIDLDELQRLHEAATREPWSADVDPAGWVAADHPSIADSCRMVADCTDRLSRDEWDDAAANAALIAAARNALPALLRLARRARRLEEALDPLVDAASDLLAHYEGNEFYVNDTDTSERANRIRSFVFAHDALRAALAEGEGE